MSVLSQLFTGTSSPHVAVWSSGPATLYDADQNTSVGVLTAGLIFGAGSAYAMKTSKFNGTVFSTANDNSVNMETSEGFGVQNAAVCGGRSGDLSRTDKFNGNSWSFVANLVTPCFASAGFGILTAGAIASGRLSVGLTNVTQKFNGTTWTTSGNLSTSRQYHASCGVQTAGLIAGASNGFGEKFDGSVWSSTASNILSIRNMSPGMFGSQNDARLFAGYNAYARNEVESYDGSIWKSESNMITGRYYTSGFGVSNGGMAVASITSKTSTEIYS